MDERVSQRLYRLFAGILEYPTPETPLLARECARALSGVVPGAAGLLEGFRDFAEGATREALEELYTRTFDLQAVCCPYAGWQMFGEDYARGVFMARLKDEYRALDFSEGNELPDHVSVILRFLSVQTDAAASEEIVSECLLPSLTKMCGSFGESPNPYGGVVKALRALLLGVRSDAEGALRGAGDLSSPGGDDHD